MMRVQYEAENKQAAAIRLISIEMTETVLGEIFGNSFNKTKVRTRDNLRVMRVEKMESCGFWKDLISAKVNVFIPLV